MLTLACFLGLPAESLIADAHEAALHDGAQPAAAASYSGSDAHASSPAPGHTTHVEHCAHGHGPALAVALDQLTAPPDGQLAVLVPGTRLPDLTAQPAQRPPTA